MPIQILIRPEKTWSDAQTTVTMTTERCISRRLMMDLVDSVERHQITVVERLFSETVRQTVTQCTTAGRGAQQLALEKSSRTPGKASYKYKQQSEAQLKVVKDGEEIGFWLINWIENTRWHRPDHNWRQSFSVWRNQFTQNLRRWHQTLLTTDF